MSQRHQNSSLSSLNEDEQFISSENIITANTASDWDSLAHRGAPNTELVSKRQRDSLFTKFDPLYSKDLPGWDSAEFKAPNPPAPKHLSRVRNTENNNNGNASLFCDSECSFVTACQDMSVTTSDFGSNRNSTSRTSPLPTGSLNHSYDDGIGDGDEVGFYVSALEFADLNESAIRAQSSDTTESTLLKHKTNSSVSVLIAAAKKLSVEVKREEAKKEVNEQADGQETKVTADEKLENETNSPCNLQQSLCSHFATLSLSSANMNIVSEHHGNNIINNTSHNEEVEEMNLQTDSLCEKINELTIRGELSTMNGSKSSSSHDSEPILAPLNKLDNDDETGPQDSPNGAMINSATSHSNTCGEKADDYDYEIKSELQTRDAYGSKQFSSGPEKTSMHISPNKIESNSDDRANPTVISINASGSNVAQIPPNSCNHPFADKITRIKQLKEKITLLTSRFSVEKKEKLEKQSNLELKMIKNVDEHLKTKQRLEQAKKGKEKVIAERTKIGNLLAAAAPCYPEMSLLYEKTKKAVALVQANCKILNQREAVCQERIKIKKERNRALQDHSNAKFNEMVTELDDKLREAEIENTRLKAIAQLSKVSVADIECEVALLNEEHEKLRELCEDLTKSSSG